MERNGGIPRLLGMAIIVLIAGLQAPRVTAQPSPNPSPKPFVVEYYYKTKWGHADEFLRLFKKNHYPLLKREQALGRIVRLEMAKARYHGTEDGRWDYRVTIVWRDAATANDGFDSAPLAKELFPDKATYDQEEQRRFEILEAHWDLPVQDVALDK